MKKTAVIFVFGILLISRLDAYMVSFTVIETGVQQEGPNSPHSQRWEDALLDVFFEAGFIVSNTQILQLESKPAGRIGDFLSTDLNAARLGGADFFIAVQLDYIQRVSAPQTISVYVFRIYLLHSLLRM